MAAKAKKEDKKKEKRIRFSFFSDMDEVRKSNFFKIIINDILNSSSANSTAISTYKQCVFMVSRNAFVRAYFQVFE